MDTFNPENLLTITKGSLRRLEAIDVSHRMIRPEEVTHLLRLADAQWQHPGGKAPHAVLTTGLHSNGFVDVLKALKYSNLCHLFAHQLVKRLEEADDMFGPENWEWTVGSDHAGAALSHSAAIWLGTKHDFTEKATGPNKEKLQKWSRHIIGPEEIVLNIEELMTTSSTLLAVREGIRAAHNYPIRFANVAGVLVDRSDVQKVENSHIVYLVHYDIETWQPTECPLCKAGSEAIAEPKKNWARLTGQA